MFLTKFFLDKGGRQQFFKTLSLIAEIGIFGKPSVPLKFNQFTVDDFGSIDDQCRL